MTPTYVRIEAVNLDQFVYDTDNLSTIRGSGIYLLQWPRLFGPKADKKDDPFPWAAHLPGGKTDKVHTISSGASSLLLRVDDEKVDPKALRDKVANYLRQHRVYRHATFVVDAIAAPKEAFAQTCERLLALNRKRQMVAMDTPIPAWQAKALTWCDVDRLRPGYIDPRVAATDIEKVCTSVNLRLQHGRDTKLDWEIITERASLPNDFLPVNDFEVLTHRPPKENIGQPLNHKMAVLYADGNGFGARLRNATAKGEEALKKWDDFVRASRRQMLIDLAKTIVADPEWTTLGPNNETRHRIELLLWGGDEHIWVVPAWQGWWALRFFFDETGKWKAPDGEPVSHAAGIVFCHHNAPIRNVVELAKRLAESAKRHRPKKDAFGYQVLESFDHLGDDFERSRQLRRPPDASAAEMILPVSALDHLPEWKARAGAKGITQGRRHQVADALMRGRREAYEALLLHVARVNQTEPDHLMPKAVLPRTALALRENPSSSPPASENENEPNKAPKNERWTSETAAWIHLIDLWDYLPAPAPDEIPPPANNDEEISHD